MNSAQLLAEAEPKSHKPAGMAPRPESSRALLGLLGLIRRANAGHERQAVAGRPDPLAGVIARPVLRALLAGLQYRCPATVLHARRTARLAVAIATELGWERPRLTYLELAALLHDLGKIGVPDNILSKPGRLSGDEAELLAVYHHVGLDVLTGCGVHDQVREMIAGAFPHYDDTETARLSPTMSLGARILAIADAYDAMRTDQPYRAALSHAEIMSALTKQGNPRFDASIVNTLNRLAASGGALSGLKSPHPADNELSPLTDSETVEAAGLCQIFSYLYILESLYDGFTVLDADLRYLLVSRGAASVFGRAADELKGQVWTSRTVPLTDAAGVPLPESETPLARAIAEQTSISAGARVQWPNGQSVQVEVQAVPLTDEGGRVCGFAEIVRNQSRSHKQPLEVRELQAAAARDPLTGVANRGELEAQLHVAFAQQKANGTPLSVLFLDIDFFKRINDNYGHAVGDEVLIGFARLMRQECYSGELIGRYGGEEFVVICPDADLAAARRRAERLRLTISQSILCGEPDLRVTTSVGIAAAEPGDTPDALLRRADKGLYEAKRTGRNRICSRTSAELTRAAAEGDGVPKTTQPTDEPLAHLATFQAFIPNDLAAIKLRGFLQTEDAKLLDAAPGQARLRMGRPTWLGGWGAKPHRQPVEVSIEFSLSDAGTTRRGATAVSIVVRPAGRSPSVAQFHHRATQVVTLLRSYFSGE